MRALFCAVLLVALPMAADAKSAKPAPAAPAAPAFEWNAEAATGRTLLVVVNIATQRAAVFDGERRVGWSKVSTGRAGKETPTGVFPILQKKKDHVSNIYDVPMPYMQRLTWDGIALHAGRVNGRPISAGCVRLPLAFARALFSATRHGTVVAVVDEPAADGVDAAIETPVIGMAAVEAALPLRSLPPRSLPPTSPMPPLAEAAPQDRAPLLLSALEER